MRTLGIAFFGFGLLAMAGAQTVTLDAFQDGKKVGFLRITRKVTSKNLNLVTHLETGEGLSKSVMNVDAIVDLKGRTLSRNIKMTRGVNTADLQLSFTDTSAAVVINSNGKKTTRIYPALGTLSGIDPTIWWFLRDKPKVHTDVSYQSFNINKMKWNRVRAIYAAKTTVPVSQKKIPTHVVKTYVDDLAQTAYYDQKGSPVVIEQGKMRFVRRLAEGGGERTGSPPKAPKRARARR